MTTNRSILPALLGFAFVAVALSVDLGAAILCLFGALVFQLAYGLWRGDLSIAELRERAEAARTGFTDGANAKRPPVAR